MAFPAAFLDELKARVGLAAIVGKRVRLIKRGREHLGLCPFHKEKTPSFTVNEDKGFYHCFGCGKHGSVFDFVMETEGLSFPEAVERLAQDAGLALPARDPESQARDQSRGALLPAMEAACAFFQRGLRMPEGHAALDYLRGRGLSDDTIARFRLGFAFDRRDALKAALLRDGFAEERLVEAGLLIRPEDSSKGLGAAAAPRPDTNDDSSDRARGFARATYDRFRGRVMFPIEDRRGQVIAFGGRILGDGEPKYLNSPETPLFHKGFMLYALSRAANAAREAGTLVVVEGYMDVIALHQAGIANAVAPLGTALTEDQIRLLWRVAPEPILCFDGDAAGQRAAARALDRALPLLKPGYSLRFAFLPAGEDPDSLIRRHGAEAMRKLLGQPLALSEALWLFETAAARPTTPEARAALEDRLQRHAQRIEDATLRAHFSQAFRDRVRGELRDANTVGAFGKFPPRARGRGASMSATRSAPRYPSAGAIDPAARAALAVPVDSRIEAERFLLALAINHGRLFAEIEEELGTVRFADTRLDRLRQGLLQALGRADDGWTAAEARAMLGNEELAATLDAVLSHPLIKANRLAQPETPVADARAAWAETARRHARLAARSAPEAGTGTDHADSLTAESEAWERRRAALEAGLGGDEAAE
ncbi:MAG: DNA primase [Acidimicrobiia bacterium]|nr:DNA primase [Acidimicrobiia bacterium]